ncbi:nuclear transport factor 2 family protein [Rapidithrix thailandica]|uniref:Nuclear transport factor 2 family protein n=1 Tax=Rapidithrix thailandica TaxID=413964 RepID=A0AAW9S1M7_9BACT
MNQLRIKQKAVENYIKAYNSFDIEGMLRDLHPNVVFKNISNGEVNLTTEGKEAFQKQAKQAKNLFREREQSIRNIQFDDKQVTLEIDYKGVLAVDLPNGMKAGDTLALKGKTIFRFEEDKIVSIEDIS